ncbi:MAG: PKD domain-containing protein [Chloroflexi bacterium]|nr:PKD domain-containing protein [Chloroflexota bacterium]
MGNGGGVYAGASPINLTNSTFSQNWATPGNFGAGGGGGLAGLFGAGGAAGSESNFWGKYGSMGTSGSGGANGAAGSGSGGSTYRGSGIVNVKNTIFANGGPTNCGAESGASATSLGNNLESGDSCNLAAGNDITGTNALVTKLGNYGGSTPTIALEPNSPAIDAGTNSGCPATDQRGFTRPLDGSGDGVAKCDIGACEYVLQPVAAFTANVTSGMQPLAVAFTNQSTGSYTSSLWNFGDGATSTLQGPTHTYASAGIFTVSLNVTGPGVTDTITRSNYITVSEAPTPTATSTPISMPIPTPAPTATSTPATGEHKLFLPAIMR